MTEPTILRRLVAISDGLDVGGLSHAFGGPIALAFHVEQPRATSDIDVNIATDEPELAFRAMPSAVTWGEREVEHCRRDGQVRLFWEEAPWLVGGEDDRLARLASAEATAAAPEPAPVYRQLVRGDDRAAVSS